MRLRVRNRDDYRVHLLRESGRKKWSSILIGALPSGLSVSASRSQPLNSAPHVRTSVSKSAPSCAGKLHLSIDSLKKLKTSSLSVSSVLRGNLVIICNHGIVGGSPLPGAIALNVTVTST